MKINFIILSVFIAIPLGIHCMEPHPNDSNFNISSKKSSALDNQSTEIISWLQYLPWDLIRELMFFFATPAPLRDNREDFMIEQSKNVATFMKVTRGMFCTDLSQKVKENREVMQAQLEYRHSHPKEKSYFLFNFFGAVSALNTRGARSALQEDLDIQLAKFASLPQDQKNKILFDMIRTHQPAGVVTELIDKGAQVNAEDKESEFTPLRCALETRNAKLVCALLKKRANTDMGDRLHTTPLMRALILARTQPHKNDQKIVELLLKYGATPNMINAEGYTALSYAALTGKLPFVQILLRNGASIFICDEQQTKNALVAAVESGSIDVLLLLLAQAKGGLIITQAFEVFVNRALKRAVQLGDAKMVNTLLYPPISLEVEVGGIIHPKPDMVIDGSTAVMDSIEGDHLDITRILLRYAYEDYYKGLPSYITARSCTLALAVRKKTDPELVINKDPEYQKKIEGVIDDLLEENPNPMLPTACPSACFYAAAHGDNALLKKLCLHSKDENALEKVLMESVWQGHAKATNTLLFCGANPNKITNNNDDTALHKAVASVNADNCQIVDDLLWFGADPNVHNRQRDTALHRLAKNPSLQARQRILAILVLKGAAINVKNALGNTPLIAFINSGIPDLQLLYNLLALGANPNDQNKKGQTPLMCAAGNDQPEVVKALLHHNADPNQRNNSGCHALTKAARVGNHETIALLIDQCADIEQAKNGMLRQAAKGGHIATMRLVLANGADINSGSSSYGNTPLHKAIQKNQCEAIAFLLSHGADRSKPNSKGITPIELATAKQDRKIIKLLES